MPTSVLDGQSGEKLLRKPFATRDYPPGVGPNAARIHVKPKEDTAKGGEANLQNSATRRFVSAIRDYPPFCGRNSRGLSKADVSKLMQTHLTVVREEKKRKLDCLTQGDGSKAVMRTKDSLNHSSMKVLKKKEGNAASGAMGRLVVVGKNGRDTNYSKDSLNHSNMKVLKKKEGNSASGAMGRLVVIGKNGRDTNYSKDSLNRSNMKDVKKKEGNAASGAMGKLVAIGKNGRDTKYSRKFSDGHRSYGVNVPLLHHRNLSIHNNDSIVTRNTVRDTLRLFQAHCRKLLQQVEAESKGQAKNWKRIDLEAASILKKQGKYINEGKIFGSVPGVEIGDEFDYRVELNLVGLHRNIQAGIDYAMRNGEHLATSIVASGGYNDELDNSGVLIYSGHGGNVMSKKKEPEDQKLERGNLALKNSINKKNPVRVIRGAFFGGGSRRTFVYDGLYEVESYWQERGPHGKMVFKFQLQRIPNQPELPWIELKNSNTFTLRKGLCVADISHGKEAVPIRAVNTKDHQKPPSFEYITRMIYPGWLKPIPSKGCNCTDRCSDPTRCSCALKNGGIPFNHTGCIVEVKSLVYECGPSCKCPPDCYSRVSQQGIKLPLEIYKTETRGWGVRSLCSIPSGSFVCEYIGEFIEDKEAEKRTGLDEYLFDIGKNLINNGILSGGVSRPEVSEGGGGFTIDAARYGNLGRFFNHSCAPNMYAQNVLYDHGDRRIPHIMLFAAENIPPLKELTYDYNYSKDQIFNSDGSIKKKDCFCGSVGCTGRMY